MQSFQSSKAAKHNQETGAFWVGPGDRCEGRRGGSRLTSFSHQLLGPSLARMFWSASHALCRGEKPLTWQTERLLYRDMLGEDVGKAVWVSEWRAQYRLGKHRGGGRTKQDILEDILGLGSNRRLIAHQLPHRGVADSPSPFTALEDSCPNRSCPVNYCYNNGHCGISEAPGCQPTCTCPPAFTDNRCFLAGNSFTPTISTGMANCSCQPQSSLVYGDDGKTSV